MDTCSLRCFGVGDGRPSADLNHSSFLYRFERATALIDCGEPISRSFKASGLSYDLIDRIFLSHLHFDHVGGFFMLIQGFWLEGRTKDLRIHAPAGGISALRQMLRAACIFEESLPFRLVFEPLAVGSAVAFECVKVTPFPTSHLERLRERFQGTDPWNFDAFCFVIESGGLRIAHTADVGGTDDLAPLVDKPLDLMVCELAHMQPEELFKFLRSRDIKRVAFVHMAREQRQVLEKIRTLARELLSPIEIAFPNDGEELTLSATVGRAREIN